MKNIFICIFGIVVGLFLANIAYAVTVNASASDGGDPAPAVSGVYVGNTSDSAAIFGLSWSNVKAFGVRGEIWGNNGYGVYGKAIGNGVGLYGEVSGASGYAIYSKGRAKVEGDLIVTGNRNLALDASAHASSEYNPDYAPSKVNDGIIGQWDNGEWASKGEKSGAYIQLTWLSPVTFNKVIIYDRSNKYDHITDGWLRIDQDGDGNPEYSIHLGEFAYGGAPKEVLLTQVQGTGIKSILIYITESAPTAMNVGLSEIECRYDANVW